MTRRGRVALKALVWAACLAPLAMLGYRALADDLTANPISFITNWLGDWTLRILLTSLAMTPLRILFRWSWPVTLRRLLGLFAFFYAALHFSVWLVLDHFFAWGQMGADIVKRPYITVGMTALVLMIPLAATSTAGAIRRLGGARWQWLHRLVYVTGVCAVLHYPKFRSSVTRRRDRGVAPCVSCVAIVRSVGTRDVVPTKFVDFRSRRDG